jgi:alpha-glucosidase
MSAPWWRDAVVYQVYLRSFADGTGDGVGDLPGLLSRLDHLVDLGVDALWVTPWYPSPMHDGGYDVADYRDIDPTFGTLDDARALLEEAHRRGLRVIADLVANHTSSEHPWFRAALASRPGSPERARYHFREGRGPAGDRPPNDWISAFGGPAWTRVTEADGRPGQWYLHLFAPQQPDLNWDHFGVRAEFASVLRFWFDLGVDGLRVDAAPALAKARGLPDHGFSPGDRFTPTDWASSPLWDVDAVHDIYREWREIADAYPGDRVFVGEVPVNGPHRLARYLRPGELHTAFTLDLVRAPWRAAALGGTVDATLHAMRPVGAPPTWVLSNHDEVRHVTRYGRPQPPAPGVPAPPGPVDLALGERRARAAALLLLALPGSAYLYQGEELGLAEVEDLPAHLVQDPSRGRADLPLRDGCRVPLPWSGTQAPFGFTAGPAGPWLPQPAAWAERTAHAEAADPGSMLALYRAALALRRALRARAGSTGPAGEAFTWRPAPPGVLAFGRGDWDCIVNVEGAPLAFRGEVLLASGPLPEGRIPPDTAVWLSPVRPG